MDDRMERPFVPSPLNGDFAAIFNWLPAPALILSKDGEAVAVNDAFVVMAGMPRAAMLGAGWLDVVEPADRDALKISVGQAGAGAANRTSLLTGQRLSTWRWRHWRGDLLIACVTDSSIADREFEPDLDEEVFLADFFGHLAHRIFGIGAYVQSLIGERGPAMDARLAAAVAELESIVHDAHSTMSKSIASDMSGLKISSFEGKWE
jgi:PAS domain-containing protein